MTDYIVVKEYLLQDFEAKVNRYLKEGYIPLGGVSKGLDGANNVYLQAMGKFEVVKI